MKATKRLLALVLCLAMFMGLATTAFAGVNAEEYAAAPEQVQWLIDHDFVEGYPDESLQLDQNITRAEFTKVLAYALGIGEAEAEAYVNIAGGPFSDLADAAWAEGFIYYCYSVGAIDGYPDGTFKPSENITGVQIAKMLLCGVLDFDSAPYVNNDKWALNAFADADAAGLFEGVSAEFDAGKAASRADTFIMLYNALFYAEGGEPLTGYGLTYIKEYDVAGLYLKDGTGAEDDPFQYEVADGIYTAASFTTYNADADVVLYEYIYENTTTTKGVLQEVDSVNLDEAGEEYFFAKVIDTDGTETWYQLFAQKEFSFTEYKEAVVIANEFASIVDEKPLKTGFTLVQVKDETFKLELATTLDDIGMSFKLVTMGYGKDAYMVESFEDSGKNTVKVATSDKENGDILKDTKFEAKKADGFLNFGKEEDYAVANKAINVTFTQCEYTPAKLDAMGKVTKPAVGPVFGVDTVTYPVALAGEDVNIEKVEDYYASAASYNNLANANYVSEWSIAKDPDGAYWVVTGLTGAKELGLEKWEAEYLSDEFSDSLYEAKFDTGDTVKYVDNDGDGKCDFAFEMSSKMVANFMPRPDEKVTYGVATSFCDVEFGGDDGKAVSLITVIDGVTYVTAAESEIQTSAKVAYFTSKVATDKMEDEGFRTNDSNRKAFMDALETYTVYFDFYGNSVAAIPTGLGDYVLVTQMDNAVGNLKGYTYTANMVFGADEEDVFDVAFPTTADLGTFYFNPATINHITNSLPCSGGSVLPAGNGRAFWTALASYYEDPAEVLDYYLLDPVTTDSIKYVSVDLAGKDVSAKAQYVDVAGLYNANSNTPINGTAGTKVYFDNNTELYIVTGDARVNGMLLKCEYSKGYTTLPSILWENIHGIYGVVETVTGPGGVTKTTAKVMVIEVTNNVAGTGEFVFNTKADTYDVLNTKTVIDRDQDQDQDGLLGFYVVNDGVVLDPIAFNQGMDNAYVRFEDGFRTIDDKGTVDLQLSDVDEDDEDHGVNYIAKSVPIYAIERTAEGFKSVQLVEKARPDAEPAEVEYSEGDEVVLVYSDMTTNYTESRNLDKVMVNVAYAIDLTKSADAVQMYFGYGTMLTLGDVDDDTEANITPAPAVDHDDVWVAKNEDLEDAQEKFVADVARGYADLGFEFTPDNPWDETDDEPYTVLELTGGFDYLAYNVTAKSDDGVVLSDLFTLIATSNVTTTTGADILDPEEECKFTAEDATITITTALKDDFIIGNKTVDDNGIIITDAVVSVGTKTGKNLFVVSPDDTTAFLKAGGTLTIGLDYFDATTPVLEDIVVTINGLVIDYVVGTAAATGD